MVFLVWSLGLLPLPLARELARAGAFFTGVDRVFEAWLWRWKAMHVPSPSSSLTVEVRLIENFLFRVMSDAHHRFLHRKRHSEFERKPISGSPACRRSGSGVGSFCSDRNGWPGMSSSRPRRVEKRPELDLSVESKRRAP
ncbi:unnamed protein product [Microthlaspi erraticum]|uniref:Uncharacterized protein n=1 Tax=Microthlaspi erraticum TaxID=1685480 RepID=A0A6D2I247_9BRAS|nr:unnamed protein product [Microthlaspi erraticum]